tara:strand:- start:24735 stop:25589 length:855 start_codon:yes stop_codon:yes gene_type:complete
MTQIVGFAGKKQSGKNTACNFILAMKLAELGVCIASRLSDAGEVEVRDVFGEKKDGLEWIPFKLPYIDVDALFENELSDYIQTYGLADALKEMAISILGLERSQVFGTDKEKNSATSLRWEDMPAVVTPEELKEKDIAKKDATKLGLLVHEGGPMTAREVLQYVGTDVFRKMNSNVWLDTLLSKIESDSPEVALVCDVRFENEIKTIQEAGGFVVGLTRDPYDQTDKHSSESEIEKCLKACDFVLDNRELTIPEQNEKIYYAVENLENVVTSLVDPKEKEVAKS